MKIDWQCAMANRDIAIAENRWSARADETRVLTYFLFWMLDELPVSPCD